jgi:HK97 family phage major capsid protein
MKTLTDLRSEYTGLTEQARGIVARAKKENRDLTAGENETFAGLQIKMRETETALQNRAVISGMEAAEIYRDIVRADPANSFAQKAHARAKGSAFNRFAGEAVRCMIKNGVQHVSDLAEMRGIISTNSAGTISEEVNDMDYTTALAAHMPLASYGMIIDPNSENYSKFPYESGSLTPAIVGEASAIGAASLTIGSYPVALQKFAAIQKVSLEVVEDYGPIWQHVAQSAAVGFSRRISQYVFDRVAATSGINTVEASGYAASAFNWDKVIDGMSTLQANDVNPSRTALCVSPQTWAVLAKQTGSGDGQYLKRPDVFADLPVEATTAITANAGATTAYLADWSDVRLIVRGIGASVFNAGTRFQAENNSIVVSPGAMPIRDLYIGTGEWGVMYYLRADVVVHRPSSVLVWENLPYPT